jgi:hypothetical protein
MLLLQPLQPLLLGLFCFFAMPKPMPKLVPKPMAKLVANKITRTQTASTTGCWSSCEFNMLFFSENRGENDMGPEGK